jgi:transaldolase
MTTVVADTGDIEAVARLKPVDCTTNPTIILKALTAEAFKDVVDEAIAWGRSRAGEPLSVVAETADRLAVSVGIELLRLVPGYVSTEVDANLSFNAPASIAKARQILASYKERGIERERVLIKLASTWEGMKAAAVLQCEGVMCNMTLLLNRAQAVASADAGAFLISPFVGRIYDWHKAHAGKEPTVEEDPGVHFVRDVYNYYKANGIATIVMGASFRNVGQIEALAGCDRLTIAPAFLDALAAAGGALRRVLTPGSMTPAPRRTPGDPAAHGLGENATDVVFPELARGVDEATFRWAMNEDPMATEKLAEGIRVFAKDLHALRSTVAKRLQ